ncbi:MAG: UbiD family decarboxylase [Desulfuromonadaceae bacterium]|nr:UbiD family decarboxylase [Desulfuromonadaceae bacterium]
MELSPLRQYIDRLESIGELVRVPVAVDPVLEIAAITDRVCKQPDGGAALLFERPKGSSYQVATNLFGSIPRVCTALGVAHINEMSIRLQTLLDQIAAPDIAIIDHQIASLPDFAQFSPRSSAQHDTPLARMNPPDLTGFPFLHSWPGDGAADGFSRYITLPQIFTVDPDGGTGNCGMYRVQLRGEREVAIQWKAGSGAARHAEKYRRQGKRMPVAVVLGGDPQTLLSAMFPLPGNLDEMTFAGFLRGSPLIMSPCQSVSLHVPVGAEIVIEGYVEPGKTVLEGPFGNHTGFYSPAAPAALMRVTAVRHRPDALIPATIVGAPPMEDCRMAHVWERLLLVFLQKLVPTVKDIHFPPEWIFNQSAIISLENPQPGMVRNISAYIWMLPWFRAARILLFVDADTAPHDLSHVAWRAINRIDFTDDIIHDSDSGRIAVDATGCRVRRPEITVPAELAALVTRRWKEYMIP